MDKLKLLIFFILALSACKQSILRQLENAETLRQKGKKTEAIEAISQIIKTHKDVQRAYYYRGLCYFDLKQYDKALADFDRIISLKTPNPNGFIFEYNPNSPFASEKDKLTVYYSEAIFHRGLSWYFMDSLEKSLADFLACGESDIQYGKKAVVWAGTVYIELGQKAAGCEMYKKAMLKGEPEAYELFRTSCP